MQESSETLGPSAIGESSVSGALPVDQNLIDAEAREYERERREQQVESLRAENTQKRQDIAERRKYANRIFCLICVWLGVMMLIVIAEGLSVVIPFKLDTSIVITAISTTTASVLGIFLIVANYLFPTSKK